MDRAPFDIGEPVVDRDSEDDDPNTAIIVNCPPKTATDWNAYRDTSVAEDNPDYPEDAPIAVVVYRDVLAEFDPDWAERDEPFSLAKFNEAGVSHYSFPAPRLKSLERSDTENGEREDTETVEDTTNTEDTADTSTDESETDFEGDREAQSESADGDEDEPIPEPSTDVLALKETLAERGMTAEIEADRQTITTEKLGVTYRVQPGEVLDGDGPHRDQIEQIVAEV
jgi:hypothetical protein